MTAPIVYVDRSNVRDGRLEELRAAMGELAEFVEEHEPQILAFNAYFSEDGKRMTVTHVHRDADSLDVHLEVAGPKFPDFAEFIDLTSIEVYGAPSRDAERRLRKKADDLGGATLHLQRHGAGFARMGEG